MKNRDFTAAMKERSDEELYEILNFAEDGDFVPDAIVAAEKEFASRDLSRTDLSRIAESVKAERDQRLERASRSLSWPSRIVFFALGMGLIPMLIAMSLESSGYDRKSSEAWTWMCRGFLFALALGIIIVLISVVTIYF